MGAILVARLDSSRLPGKALAPVNGRPLLDFLMDRLARTDGLDTIALATTARAVDRPLIEWAQSRNTQVFADPRPLENGSSTDDVAGRLLHAARAFGLDAFFRVNGDSPYQSPDLFGQAIAALGDSGIDFVTTLSPRSFPYGVSAELVRTDAFERIICRTDDPADREHATRALYRELPAERITNIANPAGDESSVRLTVDTADDLHRFCGFARWCGDRWPITPIPQAVAYARNQCSPISTPTPPNEAAA